MRGDGGIYKRKNSPFWWIRYNLRGTQHRESTGTNDQKQAKTFLRLRLKEVGADQIGAKKFIGPKHERVTVGDLLDALEINYKNRGKFRAQVASHFKTVRNAFGDRRAVDVTDEEVAQYISDLRVNGKANATVNRYTQILSQAYRLARKKVGEGPAISHLPENNVRQGFFEHVDFLPSSDNFLRISRTLLVGGTFAAGERAK
jgi:hypothetical protein